MAIGPIGNAIFVNQMTPAVANVQNAHNNRVDFQNMVAQLSVTEKEESVTEVRPAEENEEVDEDREHQRDEARRENERSPKHEEKEEEEQPSPLHHLDISV